jgi:oxalate decarboxylase/phosphoglucose isomerase-like protein (cupin superfamily)
MLRSRAALQLSTFLLAFGLGRSLPDAADAPVSIQSSATRPTPLILRAGEGERRVRRVYGGATAIIKVDGRNGGAPEFVVGSEELPPGQTIAAHRHPGADEVVFVHSGSGMAELGDRKAVIEAGATIYIPQSTRMMLRNTGDEPLAVSFVFSQPGYEEYLRATSVPEGEAIAPLSAAALAAIREQHRAHIVFDEPR